MSRPSGARAGAILDADVIIVGSGPSAAQAAVPLVDSGARVLMLDVGHEDTVYAPLIPDAPWERIRKSDAGQHRYFLGDDFEAVPLGRVRVGAQLTAPRGYLARGADTLTPLRSDTFVPTESLALGGLGGGWGASSVQFGDRDMKGWPITAADLAPHYAAVAERIGVSGDRDDLLPYYGDNPALQPPLRTDSGVQALMERYRARRRRHNAAGFYMGHPRLAVLSRDLDGRLAHRYHDMDFYSDAGGSVYRPRFTVDRLIRSPNFTYARPWLVHAFSEAADGTQVEVLAGNPDGGETRTFLARRLVVAAGTLGTARIVLRSLERYDTPAPLACNPHIYIPCVNMAMLGRPADPARHSLTQAGVVYDPDGTGAHLVYGEIHVYRSLLLFKLAKESALPVPEAARILRELIPSFVILVVEHDDVPTPGKRCVLRRGHGGPDTLEVSYALEPDAAIRQRLAEKALLRRMRRLGCWPFSRIDPGHGSSIHYGGCFPMSRHDRELTVTPSCRLRGTRTVYLADGSVLPHLPAKPLTFTLMANADRVGRAVIAGLRA